MKLSKYINKYDYIGYYTKQPAFWFYSNSEILAAINTECKQLDIQDNNELDDENDDEEANDFDAYEYYKQQKQELKDVDKNDPKIVEGIIIDNKSRQFITNEFKNIKKVVDFEADEFKNFKQEEIAEITKKMILENDEIILFQPVFIHDNLITKPDAIIKQDLEIKLIETKSTTTSKRHHFLDIYFQYKVLSAIEYLQDYYFDLNLCLVAYQYANKNEVPFIITKYFNINSSYTKQTDNINWKQLLKIGQGFIANDDFIEAPISFNHICEQNHDELEYVIEVNSRKRKSVTEFQDEVLKIYHEFNHVIKTLSKHHDQLLNKEQDIVDEILPSENEKSYWKKSDLFPKLRDLYAKKGYELFKYSGNIVNQSATSIVNFNKDKDIVKYFTNEKYLTYYINNNNMIINNGTYNLYLSKLKDKKVYFDFETINSPIRPIDHCLPFMQILTQCSVIVDDNSQPIDQVKCNNILVDPSNITINDFKNVIDSLYHGNDYSYVVYNKSFECSRLKEMATFINENEYTMKVHTIIDNIYDLLDFFKVNCKNNNCPVIIPELYGFYSIKKVLPIVMKNRIDIFNETGCRDYHSLDTIQNGLICQNETTKKFHNILSSQEWDKLSINLKKYCENDVRAMIAVEYYIKSLRN